MNAFFASFKHESGNKDTALRIRRSHRNRFENGGVVQTLPYGYVKPPGAKSDTDVSKDPAAEPIYEGWFQRLESGQSYSEVAEWFNAQGVPVGPWMRSKQWDGRMVQRVTFNPILKGFRRRNERKTKRVNKSGRRKSVKADADELLLRAVPHLAFIEPARYDRLIARLKGANERFARGRLTQTPDGRAGMPKRRTVWPGQHVACGVCGRLMYWGGHGQQAHMMCAGARDYQCWNAATFDGHEAGRRLATAVLAAAESLPGFDETFQAQAAAAAAARRTEQTEALSRLDREIAKGRDQVENLTDAVAKMKLSDALQVKLIDAEGRLANHEAERDDLLGQPTEVPSLPAVEELKARAREAVGRLAFADAEFGRQLSVLMPRVAVFPHQSVDGGRVVLRAAATIDLAPLVGTGAAALGAVLTRQVTVDLFDPPQRVAFRTQIAALKAAGRTEREPAAELGITQPAIQHAAALTRCMAAAGVADPYAALLAPPAGDGKFRRHRHPRYEFRPLPGYPLPFPPTP